MWKKSRISLIGHGEKPRISSVVREKKFAFSSICRRKKSQSSPIGHGAKKSQNSSVGHGRKKRKFCYSVSGEKSQISPQQLILTIRISRIKPIEIRQSVAGKKNPKFVTRSLENPARFVIRSWENIAKLFILFRILWIGYETRSFHFVKFSLTICVSRNEAQ